MCSNRSVRPAQPGEIWFDRSGADADKGIRAGDALHLACAERAGVKRLVTLDVVMAKNAQRVKLNPWR
jgi:predicted nucleic acid-binding protein